MVTQMWYKSSSMEEQILIGLTSADGLHYSTLSAGLYGCERLVQLLLERGANPNKASLSGNTPLLRAVWYGRAEVVQILLEHGADPNKGGPHHGCQIAIARFLDRMCLALRACGLWLRYAMLQNLIPSFPWIAPPRPPPWRNPRKGRDQILPSGNPGGGGGRF